MLKQNKHQNTRTLNLVLKKKKTNTKHSQINYYKLDKRSKPFTESDSTAGKFMLHSVSERGLIK